LGPAAGRTSFGASCMSASSLLVPVGRPPIGGAGTRLPVRSLFGARGRSALSTVGAAPGTPGPPNTHSGRRGVEAAGRLPRGTSGASAAPFRPPTQPWCSSETVSLSTLVLSLADNKQMLGLRYAEWATRAPSLEADIAAAAMGLDDLGHARVLYGCLEPLG